MQPVLVTCLLPVAQTTPAAHALAASRLCWHIASANARLQHEWEAHQRCTIRALACGPDT